MSYDEKCARLLLAMNSRVGSEAWSIAGRAGVQGHSTAIVGMLRSMRSMGIVRYQRGIYGLPGTWLLTEPLGVRVRRMLLNTKDRP